MSIADTITFRLKNIASITSLIGTGSDARIYKEYQKQGAALPHIVLEVFPGRSNEHLQGITGIATNLVQVTCYGSTETAADNLAGLVRRALQGFRGTVDSQFINGITSTTSPENGHDKPSPKGGNQYRFWVSRDYEIAYTESTVQL